MPMNSRSCSSFKASHHKYHGRFYGLGNFDRKTVQADAKETASKQPRIEADQQRSFFACGNCARQGRFLEQPEQFEHDYDDDNYSNDIEDASVHVRANIKLGVWCQHLRKSNGGAGQEYPALIYLIYRIERSVPGQHRYSQPTDSAPSTNNKAPAAAGALS
jgi:hypothetical protein